MWLCVVYVVVRIRARLRSTRTLEGGRLSIVSDGRLRARSPPGGSGAMLTRRGGTGRGEERARADLGGPRAEAGWDWETVGFFRGLIPDRLSSHRATSRASSTPAGSSRGNPMARGQRGRIRSPRCERLRLCSRARCENGDWAGRAFSAGAYRLGAFILSFRDGLHRRVPGARESCRRSVSRIRAARSCDNPNMRAKVSARFETSILSI